MKKLIILLIISFNAFAELPTWEPNHIYISGDIIEFQGNYWFAKIQNHNTPPAHKKKWVMLLPPTADTIKKWQDNLDYQSGSFVRYEGVSYIARHFSYNTPPKKARLGGAWIRVDLDKFTDIQLHANDGEIVDYKMASVEG